MIKCGCGHEFKLHYKSYSGLTWCERCTCDQLHSRPNQIVMEPKDQLDQPMKIFIQGYCQCGTSAYIPIKSSHINQLTIDNAMREFGWKKFMLVVNNVKENFWHCKKCSGNHE